jgi:S1-C subfamily serine protease
MEFQFQCSCRVRLILAIFIGWFTAFACADLPETIKKIKPSIVGVGSYDALATPRAQLKGTGFAVKNGQYIVTNFHVIAPIVVVDSSELAVMVGIGPTAKVYKAKVVAQKEAHDLAVLKVDGIKLPPLKISSDTIADGRQIAFTGFPIGAILGLYPVTHRGIVSSVTPIAVPANSSKGLSADVVKRLRHPYFIYQLDATAYPGNSGSPLYDQQTGDVVGIINKVFVQRSKEAVLSDPSGITYAIPSILLNQLLMTLP